MADDEPKVITQCTTCHRAIFTIHVDAVGDCGVCQSRKSAAEDKPVDKPKSSPRRRTSKP